MATSKKAKKTPVVLDKKQLLLPKMEFVELDSTTGAGLYVKELGGKALLAYREKVKQMQDEIVDGEPNFSQSIELMTELVLKTACNADGTPYFTREEVDLLADTSLVKLQALANFAMDVSGINAKTKEVAANLKNDENSSSTGS